MTCPRCGFEPAEGPACGRCGVVFSKVRPAASGERRAHARSVDDLPPAPPARQGVLPIVAALALGAAVLAAGVRYTSRAPSPPPPSAPPVTAAAAVDPPPSLAEVPPPTVEADTLDDSRAAAADKQRASSLADRVNSRGTLSDLDLATAEELLSRYPDEKPLADLLEAVLMSLASADRAASRWQQAGARLERAALVQPGSARALQALAETWLQAGDWLQAEAAARRALDRDGNDAPTWQRLGVALWRQDRDQEAIDALERSLQIADDDGTRALLARLRHGQEAERGMTAQNVSHFHVRYDGGEHEDVGRQVVQALERHYSALCSILDYQPTEPIPVILFSQEAYYDASGAPAWSGGAYDSSDGRVRVPIGGLDVRLTPDMDDTLRHELTHAFITGRTHGVAPREIQEGLAQFMEGKRLETSFDAQELRIIGDGRAGGVAGFYANALAFVQYLHEQRGQGGLNDLLAAMGETQDVNESFRRVYGDEPGVTRAFAQRMKQKYGS